MKWMLLLLLAPFTVLAQKKGKDTTLVYLDEALEVTSEKNGAFVGVSVKVEGGWMVYALYPDTTPVMRAYYKDKALKVKEGPYTVYFPKGQKAKEGFYHDGKMNGNWRFWHSNGVLKDSGNIINNHLAGRWKTWYNNGSLMSVTEFDEMPNLNSLQILQVSASGLPPYGGMRNGRFTSWYSNGLKESEGLFRNNQMEGDWHWFHPNGKQSTIETYKNGVVNNLQCFDTTGRATPDLCALEAPAQLKLYGDYKAFIYENLTWPEEARKKKIEGDVEVRFQVSTAGQLQNLVVKSKHPVLQKAVEELFSHMKEWYPAVSHNRVVVWEDEMVIPFRTGNYFTAPSSNSPY